MPEVLCGEKDTIYAMPWPGFDPQLDGHLERASIPTTLRHPTKGLIEVIMAQRVRGDTTLLIKEEYYEGTEFVRIRDYSCGPGARAQFARTGNVVDGDDECMWCPYVTRVYYAKDGKTRLGERVVCDTMQLSDRRDLATFAMLFSEDGSTKFEWLRKGDGTVACSHFGKDGERTKIFYSNGKVAMFTGPRNNERMVTVTKDPATSGGIVREFYGGRAGLAHLKRVVYYDGKVIFYNGNVPQFVRMVKVWYPSGKVEHYNGEHGEEKLCGISYESRQTAVEVQNPTMSFPTASLSKPTDVEVLVLNHVTDTTNDGQKVGLIFRISPNHYRSDLHGKRVQLKLWIADFASWEVCFVDSPAPKLTKGVKKWEFLTTHLMSEDIYQANRAEKQAVRAAKAETVAARRRAQRQAKKCSIDAAIATKLQNDEMLSASEAAHPSGPPLGKRPLIELLCCPIDGSILNDPVLSTDGYVYNRQTIRKFWTDHQCLISPITGEEVTKDLFTHYPIRSSVMEVLNNKACKDAALKHPVEEPNIVLCPISCDVMSEPVLADDGHVYDRSTLDSWFATGATTSPLTNASMARTCKPDKHMTTICQPWW